MTICKYYQEGRCKFGNQCKYEHVDPPNRGGPPDPFSRPSNSNRQNGQTNGRRHESRILWPLSAVGIEDNPEQGNMLDHEFSPEEMRLLAYQTATRGRSQAVIDKEAAMVSEHQQKMQALGIPVQSTPSQSRNPPPNDPFANATPQPAPPQPSTSPFSQPNGAAPSPFSPMQSQPTPGFSSTPSSNPFAQPQGFQNAAPQQGFPTPPQPQQVMQGFSPAPQMNVQPTQLPQHNQVPVQQPAQPQPQLQMQTALPPQANPPEPAQPAVPSSQAEQQFNAAQFGFSNVPESAPPPQFY